MPVNTTPHLNFRGQARAALEFYASVFGGELTAVPYAALGDHAPEGAEPTEILWGQVEAESGVRVMAYDVPASLDHDPGQIPFFVSLRGDSADEVTALWAGLADGATVRQPLGPAAWSPLYGMLQDRFGVTWVLDAAVDSSTS